MHYTLLVGVEIGELPTEQHGITGTFHVLDSKTIFIEDFNYDGMAPGIKIRSDLPMSLLQDIHLYSSCIL